MPENINEKLINKILHQSDTIRNLTNYKAMIQSIQLQSIQLQPIKTNSISAKTINNPSLAELLINHILLILNINDNYPSAKELEQYYGLAMSYLITHTKGNQFAVAYHAHPSYYSCFGFKANDEIRKYYGMYDACPILDEPANDPLGEQMNVPELDDLILLWSHFKWIDLVQTKLNPRMYQICQANRKNYQQEPVDIQALKDLWDNGLTKGK